MTASPIAASTTWTMGYTIGFISESGACPSSQSITYTCSPQQAVTTDDVIFFKYDSGAGTLGVRFNSQSGPYSALASGLDTSVFYHPAVSSTAVATWRLFALRGFSDMDRRYIHCTQLWH